MGIAVFALAAASVGLADGPASEPSTQSSAEPTTGPTTGPSTQPSFTADQRDALIAAAGKTATVSGVVSEIRDLSSRVLKISFQGLDRDGFCGIVFSDTAAAHDYFDNGAGADIVGKKITITGTVSLFRGNPEIIISDAKQVQVIGGATSQP